MQDHYEACLLGLAVGDALGFPTEFLSLEAIRRRYGPAGVTGFEPHGSFPPGTYTDDTQLTVALAEGLLAAESDALDDLMVAVGREFVNWLESPDNNRAPGNTCLRACQRLAAGADWRASGVADSKGCGSAMRAAPVGLLFRRRPERLLEVGLASSQITHGHPCALAGAVAVALAVSLALDNLPPARIPEALIDTTRPVSESFADHLAKVPRWVDRPPDEAFAALGEGWVAEEAVAAALYCVLRSPDDYPATVLTAANSAGDSDSIACIAGAISGARLGLDAIPLAWRAEVEDAAELRHLARRLYQRQAEA